MKHKILIPLMFLGYNIVGQTHSFSYKEGLIFTDNTSYSITANFRIQNLLEANFAANGDDAQTNTLVRRSRLKFKGYVFNPKINYKFELGMSNRDIGNRNEVAETNSGSRLILDAVVKYKATKNIEFWFGQTKLPGNRERVISSQALQFVDRSLVNSRFNIDRGSGIQFRTKHKLGGQMVMNLAGSWSMGEGRNTTAYNQGGFEYTGRVEFLPFGKFTDKGDYFSADLAREQKPKLSIGVTYDLNDDAVRQRGNLGRYVEDTLGSGERVMSSLSTIFVDFMFKYKGISVMGEYADKTGDNEDLPVESSRSFATGSGLSLQAGYLFPSNFEIAGRYTTIEQDGAFSSVQNMDEYTIGISRYIIGHRVKFQTDFSYADVEGLEDPELRYRFQFEIGF